MKPTSNSSSRGRRSRGRQYAGSSTATSFSVTSSMMTTVTVTPVFRIVVCVLVLLFLSPVTYMGVTASTRIDISLLMRRVLLASYGGVLTLVFSVALAWSWRRRHGNPFRPRSYPLIVVACTMAYLYAMWTLFYDAYSPELAGIPNGVPNNWSRVHRWLLLAHPAIYLPYCIRSWRLVFIFGEDARDRNNSALYRPVYSDGSEEPLVSNSSYGGKSETSFRSRLTDRFLLWLFVFSLTPFLLTSTLQEVFDSDEPLVGESDVFSEWSKWYWVAMNGVFGLLLAVTLIRIRTVADEFKVRRELFVVLCVQLVYAVGRVLVFTYAERNFAAYVGGLSSMRAVALLAISIVIPINDSYIEGLFVHYDKPTLSRRNILSLALSDPDAYTFFSTFMLEGEQRRPLSELLQFYVEVELFKDLPGNSDDRWLAAQRLFSKYFGEDTSYRSELWMEIIENSLHFNGKPLLDMLSGPQIMLSRTLFDVPQHYVFSLLEELAIPEFLRSAHYEEMCNDMKRRQMVFERMVAGNMVPGRKARSGKRGSAKRGGHDIVIVGADRPLS